jgi:hypothetical protein
MRGLAAAALLLPVACGCSGHQISSWSPSGSLAWDEPPEESDEPPDGGDGGDGPADAGVDDDDGDGAGAGPPAPRPWPDVAGPGADPATVLARADQRYAAGDIPAARSGYGLVFATGTRAQQLHALHRMAWCEQHEGRIAEAVERLVQLLALTDPPRDDDERLRRREATRDLVTFEALRPDGTAEQAVDRLERALPEAERREALERLAEQYAASGRTTEAAAVRARLAPAVP